MRVLHLCKYDFRNHNGGIESVCKSMYEHFKSDSQHKQFHYFLFFSTDNTSTQHAEDGFHFYVAGINKQLGSTPLSLHYIAKYKELCDDFDIIHVHVPNPVALLALYQKRTNAKIIIHWHSDIVKQKLVYPFFKIIEQRVLRFVTRIIATSENYVKGSKPLAAHHHKIEIIPIGINALTPTINESGYKTNHVLSIGRLVYYKGFEYLIKAASYLPDNYHITIIGNGSLHKKLTQLITDLGVQKKVTLAGRVSDDKLNELLSNCKVFCLPSVERSEAFGVVLLEALSMGKPIVATNIPYSGVNWVNEHRVTGLNVSPKNEEQLANAIMTIVSDNNHYQQFCNNAVHRFQTFFTADKMNQAIQQLYLELLNKSTIASQDRMQ